MNILKLSAVAIATCFMFVSASHAELETQKSTSKRGEKMHQRMMEHLTEMDGNHDGFIDKEEYLKDAEGRFKKMDKKNEGKVSIKDMEERQKERMEKRAERKKMKDEKMGGEKMPESSPTMSQ